MTKVLNLLISTKVSLNKYYVYMIFSVTLLTLSIAIAIFVEWNFVIVLWFFIFGMTLYRSIMMYRYAKSHNEAVIRIVKAVQSDRKEGYEVLEGYVLYLRNQIAKNPSSSRMFMEFDRGYYERVRRQQVLQDRIDILNYAMDVLEDDIKGKY